MPTTSLGWVVRYNSASRADAREASRRFSPSPSRAGGLNVRFSLRTKSLHLWVGFGGALVFLATGIYMVIGFPALYGGIEAIRYMYRANHVYLLLGSLINVAVGVYRTDLRLHWRGKLALSGSVLLWLAPFVLLFAFFFEPPRETPLRLATFLGTLMLLIGVLAQWPNRALKSARAANPRMRATRRHEA